MVSYLQFSDVFLEALGYVGMFFSIVIRFLGVLFAPIIHGILHVYHLNPSWFVFCLVLFVTLEVLNIVIAKEYKAYVRRHSYIYQDILKINQKYPFNNLPSVFSFEKQVTSSQAFANYDIEKFAKEEFIEDSSDLTKKFEASALNRFQLESYVKALQNIRRPLHSSMFPPPFCNYFEGLEREVYTDALEYPVINPTYRVFVKYDSPARRVRRRKDIWCDQAYMEKLYKRIKKIPAYKPNSYVEHLYREEAAKKAPQNTAPTIPPKIRYEVMMRDQQACLRCRRSAKDGASLDVYHKVPLYKGGKTVPENLFTLCDTCAEELHSKPKTAKARKARYASDEFIRAQRSRMTPEYKEYIKRRDHYRCQICGKGIRDGVALEVDHIKPVSLGGTSDENNLRTLCFDCNRGKGATYDPYGPN